MKVLGLNLRWSLSVSSFHILHVSIKISIGSLVSYDMHVRLIAESKLTLGICVCVCMVVHLMSL